MTRTVKTSEPILGLDDLNLRAALSALTWKETSPDGTKYAFEVTDVLDYEDPERYFVAGSGYCLSTVTRVIDIEDSQFYEEDFKTLMSRPTQEALQELIERQEARRQSSTSTMHLVWFGRAWECSPSEDEVDAALARCKAADREAQEETKINSKAGRFKAVREEISFQAYLNDALEEELRSRVRTLACTIEASKEEGAEALARQAHTNLLIGRDKLRALCKEETDFSQ